MVIVLTLFATGNPSFTAIATSGSGSFISCSCVSLSSANFARTLRMFFKLELTSSGSVPVSWHCSMHASVSLFIRKNKKRIVNILPYRNRSMKWHGKLDKWSILKDNTLCASRFVFHTRLNKTGMCSQCVSRMTWWFWNWKEIYNKIQCNVLTYEWYQSSSKLHSHKKTT